MDGLEHDQAHAGGVRIIAQIEILRTVGQPWTSTDWTSGIKARVVANPTIFAALSNSSLLLFDSTDLTCITDRWRLFRFNHAPALIFIFLPGSLLSSAHGQGWHGSALSNGHFRLFALGFPQQRCICGLGEAMTGHGYRQGHRRHEPHGKPARLVWFFLYIRSRAREVGKARLYGWHAGMGGFSPAVRGQTGSS
jgi:hypothetical protein